MISRTVEYALRAMVWLASQPDQPHTTKEVAEATQVPTHYLSKVLQTLVDANIVASQRGFGGGFVLTKPPDQFTVLDVVNAVDPFPRIRSCPLRISAHSAKLCALHQRLDDALATVEQAFSQSTMAELASTGKSVRPLCEHGGQTQWQASLGNLAATGRALDAEPVRAPRIRSAQGKPASRARRPRGG